MLVPFTETFDCCTKFVPNICSENPGPPERTDEGDNEAMCGTGLAVGLMLKVIAVVVPPPGGGVTTVIIAEPGVA
jgi:hypothetical protein